MGKKPTPTGSVGPSPAPSRTASRATPSAGASKMTGCNKGKSSCKSKATTSSYNGSKSPSVARSTATQQGGDDEYFLRPPPKSKRRSKEKFVIPEILRATVKRRNSDASASDQGAQGKKNPYQKLSPRDFDSSASNVSVDEGFRGGTGRMSARPGGFSSVSSGGGGGGGGGGGSRQFSQQDQDRRSPFSGRSDYDGDSRRRPGGGGGDDDDRRSNKHGRTPPPSSDRGRNRRGWRSGGRTPSLMRLQQQQLVRVELCPRFCSIFFLWIVLLSAAFAATLLMTDRIADSRANFYPGCYVESIFVRAT